MKKIGSFLLISVLSLVSFFNIAIAQFEVPAHDEYVTDMAGVISNSAEEDLEAQIYKIWQETDVEIAVLTVESLNGESVWYAGVQVGEERGVGDKEKDNGVVMLISVGDREWTIQVGYGLEGTLPDAIAKRIGENNFPSNFREGNYAKGIEMALEDMHKYILADPTIMEAYQEQQADYEYSELIENKIMWFVICGVVYFILGMVLSDKLLLEKSAKKSASRKVKKGGWMKFLLIGVAYTAVLSALTWLPIRSGIESFAILLFALGLVSSPSSGGSSGGYRGSSSGSSFGGFSSSSSSSSFGGFGGGSFGGGGASGSW